MSKSDNAENGLCKVPEEEDNPIPFVDEPSSSFIDCFADAIDQVTGVQYTIGIPCDHSITLCYFDDNGDLIPVETGGDLMNDVFLIVAR